MQTGVQLQVTDASTLANKAVFLRVSFGTIGNVRRVKQDVLKNELAAEGSAEAESYNKTLVKANKTLLESPELEEILKADAKLKRELKDRCLPGVMEGVLMVPNGMVGDIFTMLKEYQETTRPVLVSAFLAVYPELLIRAKDQLGPLYNAGDYPDAGIVKECFDFTFHIVNFGVPGQLKEISPALYQQAADKAEAVMVEAANEAKIVLRQTVFAMVSKLKNSLTPDADGQPKRLHKNAVINLQEFLKTFDLKNVTDDKELAELTGKLKSIIGNTNADALRESDNFRAVVASDLSAVSESLSSMVELKPGRVFKSIE